MCGGGCIRGVCVCVCVHKHVCALTKCVCDEGIGLISILLTSIIFKPQEACNAISAESFLACVVV